MSDENPDKRMTPQARALRRRATDEEHLLWRRVRGRRLDFKFRRQVPLCGYIVDFVCFEKKVVVELDGRHHAEPEHRAADRVRDATLQEAGFRVLRFRNRQIRESLDAVCEHIHAVCSKRESG
jgi:very-short-patch-repair endonuclease